MRFFRLLYNRDSRHQQLRELYQHSEDGGDMPDVDPAAREMFEADQQLTGQLSQMASSMQELDPSSERETLLSRVAEQKSLRQTEKVPMLKQLFQKRTMAMAGAAVLALGAVATVGAAGGVSDVAGSVNDVLAALQITDRGPDAEHPAEHPDVSSGQQAGLDDTDDNADNGLGNAAEGSDNAGQGIDNASDQGRDNANDNALDGPSRPDGEGPTLPTQANDHAADGPNNAENATPELPDQAAPDLPDQANDHRGQPDGVPPEQPGQSTNDHGNPDSDPDVTETPEPTETPEEEADDD